LKSRNKHWACFNHIKNGKNKLKNYNKNKERMTKQKEYQKGLDWI
jgi:hypothetical protein